MHIDGILDCGPCQLRALRVKDVPALARHANNPRVAEFLRDRFPCPYSEKDGRRFLDYAARTQEECMAGILVDGEAAGVVGVQFRTDVERCSAELGYWIGESFWGRGIMPAALRSFTSWAAQCFSLTRIYAEVFAGNAASERVLQKAGFERIGVLRKAAIKRGVHHDYVLYDLIF